MTRVKLSHMGSVDMATFSLFSSVNCKAYTVNVMPPKLKIIPPRASGARDIFRSILMTSDSAAS